MRHDDFIMLGILADSHSLACQQIKCWRVVRTPRTLFIVLVQAIQHPLPEVSFISVLQERKYQNNVSILGWKNITWSLALAFQILRTFAILYSTFQFVGVPFTR